MKNYHEILEGNLAEKVSALTGIPVEKIQNAGIRFTFENPRAIEGITRTQLRKLNLLKSFMNDYSEAVFVREELKLNSSSSAGEYFKTRLSGVVDRERFEIAFLNIRNKLIATKTMFIGTVNESPVYPREVIKAVIEHNATSIIMAHNHPGGSPTPSTADVEVTRKIYAALKTIGVNLVDHIIVAGNGYTSFAEHGIMFNITAAA